MTGCRSSIRLLSSEFSGPLSMKHIGICTQDGPEEKTGEIRFQISALSSQLDATLLVEGMECTYSARSADPYSGVMACPDGKAVPPVVGFRPPAFEY